MNEPVIQFFNRYSGQIETEQIYGESSLRWAYGNPLGRLALHGLVKRPVFSRWYGWRMRGRRSRSKILPFIRKYGLDPGEFVRPVESYGSFNEFFIRRLKASSRPIAASPEAAVFPADGRHRAFPKVAAATGLFIKGERFALDRFLGDPALAERFAEGAMLISRLCPIDYHRFHFPVGGRAFKPRMVPGPLFSVNEWVLRQWPWILWQNRRLISRIESGDWGQVTMVEVGATCVGSVRYTFPFDGRAEKGQEKGYFEFGGSAVVTLFEPGRIRFADDLLEQGRAGRELYAHMGDGMGWLQRQDSNLQPIG